MVALTLCEHCQSFSGIYIKSNRCCQVRMLANMPKEHRRREYDRIGATSGRESLADVIELVKAAYQRGTEHRARKGEK